MKVSEDEVRVILANLPGSIKGLVRFKDDYYTIILNDALDPVEKLKTYHHEMNHIQNGDFESHNSAGLIEFYAHQ